MGAFSDPRLGYGLPPAPPAPYFSLCYDTDHTAVPPSADTSFSFKTPRAGPCLPSPPQPPSLDPNVLAVFWAGPNTRAGGCLTWPGPLSGLPLGPSLWAQARGGVCRNADSDVILGSPWVQQALGPQAYLDGWAGYDRLQALGPPLGWVRDRPRQTLAGQGADREDGPGRSRDPSTDQGPAHSGLVLSSRGPS